MSRRNYFKICLSQELAPLASLRRQGRVLIIIYSLDNMTYMIDGSC